MNADQFQEQIRQALDFGDSLINKARYAESIQVFNELVNMFRAMEAAQEEVYENGPTDVPLSLRLLLINREITVPLDRLANSHLAVGDHESALEYLKEADACLEKALKFAGGDSVTMLEENRGRFRKLIENAESAAAIFRPGAPQYWIAYRGDDSRGLIRVFAHDHPASADRLRLLLGEAARRQNGVVSRVYLAQNEAEALRMAPYQF